MNSRILAYAITELKLGKGIRHVSDLAHCLFCHGIEVSESKLNKLLYQQTRRKSGSDVKRYGQGWYSYNA